MTPLHYKAGTASVCITPTEPLWLAGYAARTAPALGKLSDLYVSALVLEDERGERFVIASADMIGVTRPIADAVAAAVQSRHGLSRRWLLLTATHTHYAPEYRAEKQVFFNIPAEFAAKLPAVAEKHVSAIVEAIDQALARLEPVRLLARTTSARFAHNRRRSVSSLPIDHNVPVLDCVGADGRRVAIVFGYACHNTTIPLDDLRYCGDWAGFAKEQLQQRHAGATALFIPGAGADQDPEPRGSLDLSRQHGREIAAAVQEALDGPGIELTGPIRAEIQDVPLPLQPVTHARLREMLDSDDPPQRNKARFLLDQLDRGEGLITSYPVPVQVVRLGNELTMIALSGEPVVDWSHKFKQGAGGREQGAGSDTSGSPLPAPSSPLLWVAGYCNDLFGYLPTRRVQAEGGYEGGRATLWSWIPAPLTDEVEDRITAAVHQLLRKVAD